MPEWVVYEHAIGFPWLCDPPTPANAKREAKLLGVGYTAMRRDAAEALRNAWSAGNLHGYRQRTTPDHMNRGE